MQDTERLLASVENYLAQQELPSEPEKLYAPIGYSLSGGGKRLRQQHFSGQVRPV